MTIVEESEALHAAVREFARERPTNSKRFDELAFAIAQFQARRSPGFARMVRASGGRLDSAEAIPAVPTDAFRITRVAVHPPELDAATFTTSGTTADSRGCHVMRTTRTYRELAVAFGREALVPEQTARAVVVALARNPREVGTSSLAFMMRAFMEEFDGRALDPGRSFDALAPERWLVTEAGADVSGLTAAARTATDRGEPLIVLATAFALVALLDVLGERTLPTGSDTVIMQTGGFKGHVRAIEPDQLLSRVAAVFGIDEARVVGEYGMTELTSQLYEPVLADSALGRENRLRGRARVYVPPPWLRVTAVHPETLQPLPTGQIGLARFVDLANIDSAVAVLTQDLVRARDSGVELMGRYAGAPLRGCSLALESLLAR